MTNLGTIYGEVLANVFLLRQTIKVQAFLKHLALNVKHFARNDLDCQIMY